MIVRPRQHLLDPRSSSCVVPLHGYFRVAHVYDVVCSMRELGPPALRAAYHAGRWYLREGTHRAWAAWWLDWPILLVPVPWARSTLAGERARMHVCMLCGRCERKALHELRA